MKKKVLLIEDDGAIIDVYRIGLEGAGFEVEVIMNGKQAIERLSKDGDMPDIIFLDLLLPDMNGMEVLAQIRKAGKVKDIPILVLTNYSDSELEKMGYDLKAEKHLLKSDYTPSQLAELVKERLK
ncbi:MAG: response regulator [Candidatus Nealsonbacteria bacterium]|nr:response regulator [Candidatus Nealsonbacteria bacterium]